MRYLDEYRDGAAARGLAGAIGRAATRPWTLMEVCGGQTHTIVKYGIDRLLLQRALLIAALLISALHLRLTHRRQAALIVIGRLLLIHRPLGCVGRTAAGTVAEQELDEAAAHVRIGGNAHRRRRHLRRVEHRGRIVRHGVVEGAGVVRAGKDGASAAEQRDRQFLEHRRTLYCFV